jgi:pimeloyl-ACP methyl ester carboxylesterase
MIRSSHSSTVGLLTLALLAALSAMAAGCADPAALRMNAPETHGKVYYLDGVGCYGFGRDSVPAGLRMAGFRGDVEYWSWSATKTPLDQFGGGLVRVQAGDLAKMIAMFRKAYPGRPVSVIGLSGGTGVAVYACEQLPDGIYVDEVVLIASSLSERYDLTKALRHIHGSITLFQTNGDIALGMARVVGTIDGAPLATSAGLVGFHPPDRLGPADRELYRTKVHNVPYSASFAGLGFTGSHTSAVGSPAFIRSKIGPIITAHACDPDTAGRPAGPLPSTRPEIETATPVTTPTTPIVPTTQPTLAAPPSTQPEQAQAVKSL